MLFRSKASIKISASPREALNKLESAGCHDVAGAFQGAQKILANGPPSCCRSKHQLGISNLAGGQQPAFHNDEVGEGKQRVQLGGVLGQAAVAQLAMAEQVLDHVEGVLDPGSDLG